MPKSVCFTSCNNDYLDRAHVLARTFKMFHPDWDFFVLLSDVLPDRSEYKGLQNPYVDRYFEISDLSDVFSPSWSFRHDPEELCTAVKPFLAQTLAREGYERILFLDPDVAVFRRLHEVEDHLKTNSFLLTPHVWSASDNRRHIDLHEISCLAHGVFNLGFFALNNDAAGLEVIDFWADRLRTYCYRDHGSGLFTDQKWANFFPVFFPTVHIVRERTLNISSWNLVNLELRGSVPDLYSNFTKVGFVHFSGVGNDVFPWAASEVGQRTATVDAIFDWYKRALQSVRSDSLPRSQAYITYKSGRKIAKSHRCVFRAESEFSIRYPNPYDDVSPNSFYDEVIAGNETRFADIYENPSHIPRRY